jgi:hypothetical protein
MRTAFTLVTPLPLYVPPRVTFCVDSVGFTSAIPFANRRR